MPTITPQEARDRFGELLHAGTQTHREFDDPQGAGIWRPVYVDRALVGYRLYTLHKLAKRVSRWRTRRRP